jgi:hypothetical protein
MARAIAVLSGLAAVPALASDAVAGDTAWQAMLRGCATYALVGNPGAQDIWRLRDIGKHRVVFALASGEGAIAVYPEVDARSGQGTLCEIDPGARPSGNDKAGLALRDEAHAVLDSLLRFEPADQTGPADVWRGCASDGREFRLSSMTQTSFASFWVSASRTDPTCDYPGA